MMAFITMHKLVGLLMGGDDGCARLLLASLEIGEAIEQEDLATVDSILLRKLPPIDDNDVRLALKRLIYVSMGVLTLLSEQLMKSLPNAIVLVNLKELSSGAYKLLPESTRLVVSVRGDESYKELDILKDVDATMLLHDIPWSEDKISRVHAGRRALLVDGLGDGVLLEAPEQDFDFLRNTSFNLLQGCRMRNTKTEYVSCPSCGWTLFNLQEISAQL